MAYRVNPVLIRATPFRLCEQIGKTVVIDVLNRRAPNLRTRVSTASPETVVTSRNAPLPLLR